MIGIYKITNTINGKVYIGQSIDIEKRWKDHIKDYKKGEQVLYKAIRKYGIENFSFEVVEECDMEELDDKEIYYIKEYCSYIHADESKGYNMTLGGEGNRGLVFTKEHKRRLSESRKGKHHTQVVRKRMSETRRGENNNFYNKCHTDETKKKMSESKKQEYRGGGNPKARKTVCEGREFDCIKDCAKAYEVAYSTMRDWLNGRYKMPQRFIELDLHYLIEEELDKVGLN